ncbi:MAG TPA: TonB-dependent receptor plug domain-containing protein, partial [Kofleriaceae bacterium]|nr:TonB-dependent receptor plug domain-containing protein [Kofleriaceae bacterium]
MRRTASVLATTFALATTASAHPKHPAGDPSEPTGGEVQPPDVPGTQPRPAAPQTQPAPVQGLNEAQLEALANRAAEETIVVEDEAPAESASSIHLDHQKLGQRSRTQMSDVLRQVPGLMVSQHAGGGKSDQYFIRGFDADHGTDIAVFADGVPVNLTSHGHGQGYADTHWLIPETIDAVDMHKGPYAARYGDFYTAGALELKTLDSIKGSALWLAGSSPLASTRGFSSFDRRMVGMASPSLRRNPDDKTLLAIEIGEADGAFVNPQDFQRAIAMTKWQGKVGPGRLKLETNWYTGRWNQSGQIPQSLVDQGKLDRFGAVDPSEGGRASRGSVALGYDMPIGAHGKLLFASYGVGNKLDLFSNFTLYARDMEHGDQIEQTDARLLYGLDAKYEHTIHGSAFDAFVTSGVQLR